MVSCTRIARVDPILHHSGLTLFYKSADLDKQKQASACQGSAPQYSADSGINRGFFQRISVMEVAQHVSCAECLSDNAAMHPKQRRRAS